MRKRDLAILMLSAFAIFFSLQHEGDLSYRESWLHLVDEIPVKHEVDRLPLPVVADLNGDGKNEVLIATYDSKILVLDPHHMQMDEGFSEAKVLAEFPLVTDKVPVAAGRRAVAMATGVIDRGHKPGELIKQVLVVVTSDWYVICYNHNLKKLWEVTLQEDFPHSAHHREIGISISNYTLKHGDTGLVVVGGRMEFQPQIYNDPLEEFGNAEKSAEQHRRSAKEGEDTENTGTVNLRHFAFYAFDGRTGSLRWSRKNEGIEEQSADEMQQIPQHNYKLDVHALNSRRPGELECREFRQSVLEVMPHHWDRREDTLLKLSHFKRHKRKAVKKQPGKASRFSFQKPEESHVPGKDPSKKVSALIGKAAKYAGSANFKKRPPYIPIITNHTELWWVPNVVVAHQKEGIEVVHLASGRTVCKLHLQEGSLHVDINGDGVLDHVQAIGSKGMENAVGRSMEMARPCWAIATSGIPPREQLFNASICYHSPFNLFQHTDLSRSFGHSSDVYSLEVATPIFIPRNGHDHLQRGHGDVIFLTSRGEVTSYSPSFHGHGAIWQWQLLTDATWSNLPSPSGMMEAGSVVPTLKVFSLRAHNGEKMILAAGDQTAVVISPGGTVQTSFDLPAPPTHAIVCEDFSGDGLTDLIVVTSGGVYGFAQRRTPGAVFFSTLVGCLLIVMGVIFVTQQLNSLKGKPRSSFDYQ